MAQAGSEDTTTLPVTRRQIEAQVDALIDLLDTLDPDPDSEPELGWSGPSGYAGESTNQAAPDFCGGTDDREGHDDTEDGADGEPSLAATESFKQDVASYYGHPFYSSGEFEQGVGPVRKPRPPSKTGGAVYRGTAVLGCSEPPRNPRTFSLPMANPKRRAAR